MSPFVQLCAALSLSPFLFLIIIINISSGSIILLIFLEQAKYMYANSETWCFIRYHQVKSIVFNAQIWNPGVAFFWYSQLGIRRDWNTVEMMSVCEKLNRIYGKCCCLASACVNCAFLFLLNRFIMNWCKYRL